MIDHRLVELEDRGDMLLRCPACRTGTYLHHVQVEVYDRTEDALYGRRVTVGDTVVVDAHADMRACPSDRRDGLTVQVWCENCGSGEDPTMTAYELCVVQHKGETYLYWRERPAPTARSYTEAADDVAGDSMDEP